MAEIVLVCGGRDYENHHHVRRVLDEFHATRGITLLVEGGAGHWIHGRAVPSEVMSPRCVKSVQGADLLAEEWAIYHRVPFWSYPVTVEDWKTRGKKAGPLRNQRMLDERKPTVCIAFPGGRGTADMVRRATAAGIEVIDG